MKKRVDWQQSSRPRGVEGGVGEGSGNLDGPHAVDDLADSREETFEFRFEGAPAAMVIRATHAFGNVAVIRVPISRK